VPKIPSIFLMAFAGAAAATALARLKKKQLSANKGGGRIASRTWRSAPYATTADVAETLDAARTGES
jgi:hypothetical protein